MSSVALKQSASPALCEGLFTFLDPRTRRGFHYAFWFLVFFLFTAPEASAANWRFQDGLHILEDNPVLQENIMHKELIRKFYEERDHKPYWLVGQGIYREYDQAERLHRKLKNAWQHGLNPQNYLLDHLEEPMARLRRSDLPVSELLLTQAFLEYARDLSGIRITPKHMRLRPNDWRKKGSYDTFIEILKSKSLSKIYREIEPQGRTYQKLQDELKALWHSEKTAHIPLKAPKDLIRPAENHPLIPLVRRRLELSERRNDEGFYDQALVNAVVDYQYKHGLYADGIIGKHTIKALNKSREDIIKQIIVNLERLRWLPEEREDRYVMVNVPSAVLWVVDNGRIEMEMDVMVGKVDRPTLPFVTTIDGIRLNPTWTVPETIKREDILPKLKEDVNYLNDKEIRLYRKTEQGQMSLDPTALDWNEMSWPEVSAIRMVQGPGAENPLGSVRVFMPNEYNIYLHSTNDPRMFENYDAAVSSGCVRMKEPEAFSDFILSARDDWEEGTLQELLDTGKTKNLFLKDPVPVYLLYQTAWLRDDGELILGPDIYGRDEKLWKVLKKAGASVISH